MSEYFGKRQAGETSASSCKRSRVSAADESLTTTGEVKPKENNREQPVADFANCFVNTEVTPIEYCGKITLQPEELLLYCLGKISSPGSNINLAKGYTPGKYLGITQAVSNVYGIRFDCVNIQNYFYRSINNLKKGLGKYNGYLRWKFYSSYIGRIISTHQTLLLNLLLNSGFRNMPGNFDAWPEITDMIILLPYQFAYH